MPLLATLATSLSWPTSAAAADDEPSPIVLRATETPTPAAAFRPGTIHELRFARELAWTRLTLADDSPFASQGIAGEVDRPSAMLANVDLRNDLWTMTPRAMTSVASVASALMTQGVSVWEVRRGHRIMQRHAVRAFYRSGGLKLVWRIEF